MKIELKLTIVFFLAVSDKSTMGLSSTGAAIEVTGGFYARTNN